MSDLYYQLLDATIHYLEQLKANGERFVPASASALRALAMTPMRPQVTGFAQAATQRRSEAPAALNKAITSAVPAPPPPLSTRAETAAPVPAVSSEAKAQAMAEL